ncbi:MAG: aminoglycoside phosphotransferase family protein [Chloroflexota bacterium]
MDLSELESLEIYREVFTEVRLWAPYVEEVCNRHGWTAGQVRAGTPGTYPTFIVDDHWVVKFFGRLFDGEQAFETERILGNWLEEGVAQAPLAAPEVCAQGELFPAGGSEAGPGWPWPYLIFRFVPGVSIGEGYGQVGLASLQQLASELGHMVRRLHGRPLPAGGVFQPGWEEYLAFLDEQWRNCSENQRAWGSLPERLVEQIGAYVLPPERLVSLEDAPHLIHADLTRDHILGSLEDDTWHTAAVIDWGDAQVGNLLYELAALHLDLFACDRRLLRAFMQAYDPLSWLREDFPRKALSVALLHRFDVMGCVFTALPEAGQVETLEELGRLVWDWEA